MDNSAEAPRFHALLQQIEERAVLTMPSDEWSRIDENAGDIVPVDISVTPMADVASEASVLACAAMSFGEGNGWIEVYRDDPKDAPKNVNLDRYQVWEGNSLRTRPDFDQIVIAAATAVDDNMLRYLDENIFLVKQIPGKDFPMQEHHQTDLPKKIKLIYRGD